MIKWWQVVGVMVMVGMGGVGGQPMAHPLDAVLLPYLDIRNTHIPDSVTIDARFKQAVMLHNTAYLTDQVAAARQAKRLFEAIPKTSTLYPYALAYGGSVGAIIGKLSTNPIEKLMSTSEGLKKLKQANQSYRTVSVIIPILQANVCLSVPDFFNAVSDADAAASYLIRVAQQTPLHPDIEGEIYRLYGDVQRRKRNPQVAIVYWKKAVAIAPQSMGGVQAAAQLKKETE